MKTGYTDRPAQSVDEDIFGIKTYIDGLSEFILACNTPMTIAIQGDWGSGKTSIMNMVKETIKNDCLCSWFNTWEYAQFNMSDELAISLLKSIVDTLSLNSDMKNKALSNSLRVLGGSVKHGALIALDAVAGGRVADTAEKIMDGITVNQVEYFESIKILKKEFQKQINDALAISEKHRVVIFVDDLDRLNPEKAVEMLEILKNFLDCENCVFVLAIDYQVVSIGVQMKYQNFIDDDKGKAFFEKIIQLPFKVPVYQYDLHKFVQQSLHDVGFSKRINVNKCLQLIHRSIGKNPRAIKRLFNSTLLLMKIDNSRKDHKNASTEDELILFAILCMQLSFEEAYNFLVENIGDISNADELIKFTKIEYYTEELDNTTIQKELGLSDDELIRLTKFMKALISTIDKNNPEYPSDSAIKQFVVLVLVSTITSTLGADEDKENLETLFRNRNREICKNVINRLGKDFGHDFKVYQVRKNRADWSKQDACMWHKFQYGDLTLHHELVFKTDLEKQVTLTFSQIRAVGTDDPDILHAIFKNHREVLGNYYNEGIPFGYKNSFKIYKNEDAQAIAYETTSFFRERIKKLEGLLKL